MRVVMLALALLAASPALAPVVSRARAQAAAQGAPEAPASDNGRYSMTPTADGFLRLNTRTGKVSLCAARDGLAQCRAAADEREGWEREIARLRRENEALKARAAGGGPIVRLPNEQEVDQALGFMEKMIRRFERIFRDPPGQAPQGEKL